MTLLKSCVLESDFNTYVHSSMVKKPIADLVDGWAWHEGYKAAYFVDTQSLSLKASVQLYLGYFKAGDTIELSADFYNISGTKGKIALEVSQSSNLSNVTLLMTINSTKTGTGEFEHVTGKFVCPQDGYYNAVFGTFTGEVSNFYMRNCVAKIKTIVTQVSSGNGSVSSAWFSARRDAALPLVNATNTQMTFETSANNNGANFALIDSATGRIKFTSSGLYEIYAYVSFAQNATGDRLATLSHVADGKMALAGLSTGTNLIALHQATVDSLLDFTVRQTSGAELGVTGNIRIRKIADI